MFSNPNAVWRIALLVLTVMIAYPPWCASDKGRVYTLGYAPIFTPPYDESQIDLTRLALQGGATLCLALVASGFRLPKSSSSVSTTQTE